MNQVGLEVFDPLSKLLGRPPQAKRDELLAQFCAPPGWQQVAQDVGLSGLSGDLTAQKWGWQTTHRGEGQVRLTGIERDEMNFIARFDKISYPVQRNWRAPIGKKQ
jgi:hypothetical protein